MRQVNSLNHTRWECKYHIVFIPIFRKKVLFGEIHRELGEVFRRLARQKESLIEAGHLLPDLLRLMVSCKTGHRTGLVWSQQPALPRWQG